VAYLEVEEEKGSREGGRQCADVRA
jgi:hypothetical protein